MADMEQVKFPRQGSDYTPLPRSKQDGRVVAHAVQTINATPHEVYQVYSRGELLPTWQEGVISVTATGDNTFHWLIEDPGTRKQMEFDSEVLEAVPGERHVSRIVNGPLESTTNTITFVEHPAGRGTIVAMISDFRVPGGVLANAVAAVVSRSPEQTTIENLRHLKELIESKEIPTVEGQPAGPRGVMGKWKQFLMGENMPTPPGTSDRARPQDMPEEASSISPLLIGGVAVVAGAAAWYGVRAMLDE
ncbi:Polyketide cyclase / dehydrase and lipid transport [Terriglobus roseus DSM 18391]|uniref:Polyketide cyclase / dehydrase and lipid transport n=1 Tax=Terriglobus roseus (strain DSM 18391 / NRRL B-41598 / KBS 63) TaxID=926566 RepID=I3ZCB7_TERRK|nr:SRPBCC family protein [Terriglobus roseus]AFL86885.1 Polyketide cyclase / dehydrase and lipid transport [Terriglobus roseus DSM 18391]